jgi:hypothetical protein
MHFRLCVPFAFVACLAACSDPTPDGGAGGAGSAATTGSGGATTSGGDHGSSSGSGASGAGGATGDGGGSSTSALPLGQVQAGSETDCPQDPSLILPNATCHQITVTCLGLEDVGATIAIAEPASPIGTVVVHDGGGGTDFFGRTQLTSRYVAAGYRVVDVRWSSEWEATQKTASIKATACRPATLLRYVFDQVHGGALDRAFCGQGQSGGSAAMSYAVAHYGLGDVLDYVMVSSGPPFGRLDCGCGSTARDCVSPPPQCPELTSTELADGRALPSKVAGWEGLQVCGAGASSADLEKYAADSVVSPGASYDYPKTGVSGWFCGQSPNGTGEGGALFLAKITAAGAPPQVFCGTNCSGESIYDTSAVLSDGTLVSDRMVDELRAGCRPHHQP